MNLGDRVAEDKWFAYNTLTLVFRYLDEEDLLNASKVCPMWQNIIRECFLHKQFISTCTRHIEDVIRQHKETICCLQLIDTHQIVLEVSTFMAIPSPEEFKFINCHPKLISQLAGEQYEFGLKNSFIKKTTNLSALRIYTDRLIYLENPNIAEINSKTFYWRSLLRIKKYLTNLELGFYIPKDFGAKVLKHLKSLETLKLHLYSGVDEHIFKAIACLKNLRELIILKVYVNDDLTHFLPSLQLLEKLTIMIRAPCDTSYSYLLKSVANMGQNLTYFTWVINDVTVSDVFFGQNCQTLLKMERSFLFDKHTIEKAMKKLFYGKKVSVLLADAEYFPNLQRSFKRCFYCAKEKVKKSVGISIDTEEDNEKNEIHRILE